MGEVIVITSGKGGVGKTTTTANLGSALALEGKKVVLVDTDIGLRNLDVVMGLENRIVYDIVDVVEEKCKLRQALIKDKRFDELFLSHGRPGFRAYFSYSNGKGESLCTQPSTVRPASAAVFAPVSARRYLSCPKAKQRRSLPIPFPAAALWRHRAPPTAAPRRPSASIEHLPGKKAGFSQKNCRFFENSSLQTRKTVISFLGVRMCAISRP